MTSYTLRVYGHPIPQPRHKVGPGAGGRPRAYLDNDHPVHAWRYAVKQAAVEHGPREPLTGPVRLDVTLWLPRPGSHWGAGKNADRLKASAPKWYTKSRCDADNAAKAIMDAMTDAGVWKDDGQVVILLVYKRYEDTNERPGATIRVVDWREEG